MNRTLTVTVGNELALFKGDLLLVGLFEGKELSPAGRTLDETLNGLLWDVIEAGDVDGSRDSQALVYTHGRIAAPRVLLVGLGKREKTDVEMLRRAAGNALRRAREGGMASVGCVLHSGVPVETEAAGEAIAEGAIMGLYEYLAHRNPDPEKPLRQVNTLALLDPDPSQREALRAGAAVGDVLGRAANLARDLSNEPPNHLPPLKLAERARALAEETGMRCSVLAAEELQREGFRALLAVGQGSIHSPAFIVLEHNAHLEEPPLVFVGKGLCFDSGGLSLKTSSGMMDMKHDMAGAAAVLGAMWAIATLKVPRKVVGLIAAAENMPSGTAQRPGDVIRALDGTTIEVLNTDAEGRLVLADALAYAKRFHPAACVDLATLTGAVITALGHQACGMLGRHDEATETLMNKIRDAASATHERVWQLPLWDEYDEDIKSDIADVKNIGSGSAGAIIGATFLKKFAVGYPWVHLDIAGTMTWEKTSGYTVKGASGFGARLLTHLARHWNP